MDRPLRPWYRMDNASFMYSSIQRDQFSAIYRFSAVMTERVVPEALQAAVDHALPRFPGFAVKICRGFFWYYFEPNDAPGPYVREDVADPCRPVRFNETAAGSSGFTTTAAGSRWKCSTPWRTGRGP